MTELKFVYIKLFSTIVWCPNKENIIQKFNIQNKLGFVAGVRQQIQYEFCPTSLNFKYLCSSLLVSWILLLKPSINWILTFIHSLLQFEYVFWYI
ncbi:hypothetical protein CD145_03625 [Staphylococcus saccharolyticus]|nr:hypothetical protein CD145_03625 [Staphylococcus saccharolyticus]TAA98352.1 hypothetical protein DMB72_07460 [Staphylococcus saccharolyticus]TAA98984.1 hypothetical protein DMB73_07450 [Staphylococcus saccharolyticus]TAB02390.1 hypothetical protein DMB78_07460 [Staphylococcus saccharolyticus]